MLRLRVLACDEAWSEMSPNAGGRHCERCALDVVDTRGLGQGELDALVERARSERVCARFERRGSKLMLAAGLAVGVTLAASGCVSSTATSGASLADVWFEQHRAEQLDQAQGFAIGGVVVNMKGEPIESAVVVLQSTALDGTLERLTNAHGLYSFAELEPGNYTLQVLAGTGQASRIIDLGGEMSVFRADFRLDPDQDSVIMLGMVVESSPIEMSAESSMHFVFD